VSGPAFAPAALRVTLGPSARTRDRRHRAGRAPPPRTATPQAA